MLIISFKTSDTGFIKRQMR